MIKYLPGVSCIFLDIKFEVLITGHLKGNILALFHACVESYSFLYLLRETDDIWHSIFLLGLYEIAAVTNSFN